MALVGYSESDSSDPESYPKVHPQPGDNANLRKPTFQKVVDRSNPKKILVNLPDQSNPADAKEEEAEEPLTKKLKLESSTFSGFNSILPVPKKTSGIGRGVDEGDKNKGGLRTGVNLKTGATLGFNQEAPAVKETHGNDKAKEEVTHLERSVSPSAKSLPIPSSETSNNLKPEPSLKVSSMMFKPLSVGRKTKKKTSIMPSEGIQTKPNKSSPASNLETGSKISLFPSGDFENSPGISLGFNREYQPLIYEPSYSSTAVSAVVIPEGKNSKDAAIVNMGQDQREFKSTSDTPKSLSIIAEDLNLSASAKRQLLGRHRIDPSKINLVNFNTDQEYAANELLRQAGEQAQHNPVRAIAPGKHSLKQLVNAASSQKDALEEHFATGKRNKKEAGSKYGW